MEEPPHLRVAVEGPPTPHPRVEPLNQLLHPEGCLSPREMSNLLPNPLHGLLPGNGIEVLRVRPAPALGGRHTMADALLHLVSQELDALADMHEPRLLRVDARFTKHAHE